MKCQNLFFGKKNKKNKKDNDIGLSSVELAQRVVKVTFHVASLGLTNKHCYDHCSRLPAFSATIFAPRKTWCTTPLRLATAQTEQYIKESIYEAILTNI